LVVGLGINVQNDEDGKNLSNVNRTHWEQLVLRSQVTNREKRQSYFSNFINDIETTQEFIIEQGKLYRTQKKPCANNVI